MSVLNLLVIKSPLKTPGLKRGVAVNAGENDQVVIGLTYIKTGGSWSKNRLFWKWVRQVYKTMEKHDGIIAYGISREIFGKQGWTISVWQDDKSLNNFVQSDIHQQAIKQGMPALVKTSFTRLTTHKDNTPLSWQKVKELINNQSKNQPPA